MVQVGSQARAQRRPRAVPAGLPYVEDTRARHPFRLETRDILRRVATASSAGRVRIEEARLRPAGPNDEVNAGLLGNAREARGTKGFDGLEAGEAGAVKGVRVVEAHAAYSQSHSLERVRVQTSPVIRFFHTSKMPL